MEFAFSEDCLLLKAQLSIYSVDVLHKCFYWYTAEFAVDIEVQADDMVLVRLCPKNKDLTSDEHGALVNRIKTDLIDFKARDIITKETRNIRDLLVAKAFAHSDQFDSKPAGNVSDPLGYDPE